MINASKPESVASMELNDARLAKRAMDDARWVLSDPRGRRVIWNLMMIADPLRRGRQDLFEAGQRDVTLSTLRMVLAVDPRLLKVMPADNELEDSDDSP